MSSGIGNAYRPQLVNLCHLKSQGEFLRDHLTCMKKFSAAICEVHAEGAAPGPSGNTCGDWEEQGFGGDETVKAFAGVDEKGGEKDWKLSIIEGWNEGKNKAITSCKDLEERFQECTKKEGLVLVLLTLTPECTQ